VPARRASIRIEHPGSLWPFWLEARWTLTRMGVAALAGRAPLLSNEDTWRAARAMGKPVWSAAEERAMIDRVMSLSTGPPQAPSHTAAIGMP
jgi:hypothetical protein